MTILPEVWIRSQSPYSIYSIWRPKLGFRSHWRRLQPTGWLRSLPGWRGRSWPTVTGSQAALHLCPPRIWRRCAEAGRQRPWLGLASRHPQHVGTLRVAAGSWRQLELWESIHKDCLVRKCLGKNIFWILMTTSLLFCKHIKDEPAGLTSGAVL